MSLFFKSNSYKSFISHFNLIIDKNNKINISIEKHKYYDSSSYVKYQITSVHIPKFATSARMEGKRTKNYKARNRTRINKKKKRDRVYSEQITSLPPPTKTYNFQ